MAEIQPLFLDPDRALSDINDDKLGHRDFAIAVAKALWKTPAPDGLVVGLHGPWGSGKTSVMNFIRRWLETQETGKPTIVVFNPWWIAGREELAHRMFGEIARMLKVEIGVDDGREDDTVSTLLRYGDGLAGAADVFASPVGVVAPRAVQLGVRAVRAIRQKPRLGIAQLKENLITKLRSQKHRVLVIVDDIDRLTTPEIRELFQAIKALGDLPGFVYLLAFDRKVVATALDALHDGAGMRYLEKVVQASFELPEPRDADLYLMLKASLDVILRGSEQPLYSERRMQELWSSGMNRLITTPRDVRRLCNSVGVTFPSVSDGVNPVDFVGVETLRVFSPEIYRKLASNGRSLTQTVSGTPRRSYIVGAEVMLGPAIGELGASQADAVSGILRFLFPIWGESENVSFGSSSHLDIGMRVCSRLSFGAYFQYALPSELSGLWFRRLIASAENSSEFESVLRECLTMSGGPGLRASTQVLNSLIDYVAGGSLNRISRVRAMLRAVFSAGDDLALDGPGNEGTEGYTNLRLILNLMKLLLAQVDVGDRTTMLSELLVESPVKSISCATWLVIELGQEHGLYVSPTRPPAREQLIPKDRFEKLIGSALSWIRRDADAVTLMNLTQLRTLLQFWQESSANSEAREWVDVQTKTDEGLRRLLIGVCGRSDFGTIDLEQPRGHLIRPVDLEPWLPVEPTVERILRRTGASPNTALTYAELHYLMEYAVAKFRATRGYGNQEFQRPLSRLADLAKVTDLDTTNVRRVVAIAREPTVAEMPSATDSIVSAPGPEVGSAADTPVPPSDVT